MKRSIVVLSLASMVAAASISLPARADEPVVAEMKYLLINGKPAFGARWFAEAKLGIVNLGLEWSRHDSSVSKGFKLSMAADRQMARPALPADCALVALSGNLSAHEHGTSPLSMTVEGEGCEAFIESLRTSPLEIVFMEVPHLTDSTIVSELRLRVEKP